MEQATVVGIVVLTWNGRDDTLRCLRSLEQATYPALRVLVVDNGSTDGTVEAIRAAHPSIEILELGRNTGFTGGNNAGLTTLLHRGTDILGVLNNDTVVPPGFLEPIVAGLRSQPNAFVSPRVVHLDDPGHSWFERSIADPYTGVAYSVDPSELSDAERDLALRPSRVIPGAALFATRAVWERVGMFDDRYFLMFEDYDWSDRARRAGAQGYCVTGSTISHAPSSSFTASRSTARDYYYCRNSILYLRAHGPRPSSNIYRCLRGELTGSLRALARTRDRAAVRKVAAQVEGIVDAALGRWSIRRRNWLEPKD